MNPKTLFVLATSLKNGWMKSPPLTEDSAMPPRKKRKKLKGYQKGKRK